jgi:hypothetical protein
MGIPRVRCPRMLTRTRCDWVSFATKCNEMKCNAAQRNATQRNAAPPLLPSSASASVCASCVQAVHGGARVRRYVVREWTLHPTMFRSSDALAVPPTPTPTPKDLRLVAAAAANATTASHARGALAERQRLSAAECRSLISKVRTLLGARCMPLRQSPADSAHLHCGSAERCIPRGSRARVAVGSNCPFHSVVKNG